MPNPLKPIAVTASLTLDWTVHGGTTVVISKADGFIVTLPAATGSGVEFDVLVGTAVTSSTGVIKVANASDTMTGTLAVSTDIGGTVAPTAADSDTITMNGGTTGGLKGSRVFLKDVGANLWAVSGGLVSTGTEATPFGATVS
jgi:hypothetical protein